MKLAGVTLGVLEMGTMWELIVGWGTREALKWHIGVQVYRYSVFKKRLNTLRHMM